MNQAKMLQLQGCLEQKLLDDCGTAVRYQTAPGAQYTDWALLSWRMYSRWDSCI